MSKIFNLSTIEKSLKGFQKEFPDINDLLAIRREALSDMMISQIIEAYDFLNTLLLKDMDLFTPAGLHALLEMNHIVLCGSDRETRMHYYNHITETRKSFLEKIKPVKEWVLRYKDNICPYRLATGFYSRMLSRPQLFLEGNHRTGNILLNYLLISKEESPYVVSRETAHSYLDLSGDIKFTDKGNTFETALKMPGYRKRFQSFLEENSSSRFLSAGGAHR